MQRKKKYSANSKIKDPVIDRINIFWYTMNSIFIIVFNLYFFLLTNTDRPSSVWISYGSIHLAYIVLLLTPFFVRKGSSEADYRRPLFVITAVYFFVALVVGIIFIKMSPEKYTMSLLVQVTIAAVSAVLLLANLIANEHTANNIEKHEKELEYVKGASLKLKSILGQLSNNTLRKKVEKVYDLVHSSQVKSSDDVTALEREVISQIEILGAAVIEHDPTTITSVTDKIYELAEARNSKLKKSN